MAKLAIVAAAAGVGRPANIVCSSSESDSTLNRARRSAAQQVNTAAMLQIASLCRFVNCGHIFTNKIAGARPNETRSHRLSSWAPKSLTPRVMRATWPSMASNSIATQNQRSAKHEVVGRVVAVDQFAGRVAKLLGRLHLQFNSRRRLELGRDRLFDARQHDDGEEPAHEVAQCEQGGQNGDGANWFHLCRVRLKPDVRRLIVVSQAEA